MANAQQPLLKQNFETPSFARTIMFVGHRFTEEAT
jgi:hypothetical protein